MLDVCLLPFIASSCPFRSLSRLPHFPVNHDLTSWLPWTRPGAFNDKDEKECKLQVASLQNKWALWLNEHEQLFNTAHVPGERKSAIVSCHMIIINIRNIS